ncbi:MAG TPA: malate dehydrogenase, partial [Nitratifractor sp.]|nr:malate dehydrogenase [Nitratifractor sp.]
LSKGDVISQEMVSTMATDPIIFACANPDPEILPDVAKDVRPDVIIGTGRSDYPNQVNNVLGFPNIFRGALDVRASHITENMKMAAAKALAGLAREDVPSYVKSAHSREDKSFGSEYIIPSPFDKRVMEYVAPAVAQAAVDDGVARVRSFIKERYVEHIKAISEKI